MPQPLSPTLRGGRGDKLEISDSILGGKRYFFLLTL